MWSFTYLKGGGSLYTKILVPVDGSDHSLKTAEEAFKIAKLFGSRVTALFVVDTRQLLSHEEDKREEVKRRLKSFGLKALEKVEELAGKLGVDVETVIREGVPAEEIVDFADEIKADLIVICTRGLTGLKRIVIGSTTYRVVEWASCRVLVIK